MIPMFFSCNKLKLSFFALSFLLADLIIKCVFVGGDYFDFMKQTKIGSKSMAWMKLLDTVFKEKKKRITHTSTQIPPPGLPLEAAAAVAAHTPLTKNVIWFLYMRQQ